MSDDLVKRLRANGLDECDEAIARIEALEAQVRAADALAEWVEGIIEDGCPACGGDCSSANPPPGYCPQKEATNGLAAYRATKEGGAWFWVQFVAWSHNL